MEGGRDGGRKLDLEFELKLERCTLYGVVTAFPRTFLVGVGCYPIQNLCTPEGNRTTVVHKLATQSCRH